MRANSLAGAVVLLAAWQVFGAGAAAPVVTTVLGRPTHESITVNVRSDTDCDVFVEYGRVFLPGDERPPDRASGMLQSAYTISDPR